MKMFLWSALFVVCVLGALQVATAAKASKSKGAVAVPRKVKGGNPISRSFFGSVLHKAMREIKGNFCSELEGLTLQLTRPNDAAVPLKSLTELVSCLNNEYETAFPFVLLSKLAKKLWEPNVYTKVKALVCLHRLAQEVEPAAQAAITKCVHGLSQQEDEKVGMSFFSPAAIEQAANTASNVAELETVEIAREYSTYVLDIIKAFGDKKKVKEDDVERAELLLNLLETSETIEDSCEKSQGQLAKQCVTIVAEDRSWLVKQLLKVYEAGISDEELEEDIVSTLNRIDPKLKLKVKSKVEVAKPTSKTVSAAKEFDDEDGDEDEYEEKIVVAPKKPAVPAAVSPAAATAAPHVSAPKAEEKKPAAEVEKKVETPAAAPAAFSSAAASSSAAAKPAAKAPSSKSEPSTKKTSHSSSSPSFVSAKKAATKPAAKAKANTAGAASGSKKGKGAPGKKK